MPSLHSDIYYSNSIDTLFIRIIIHSYLIKPPAARIPFVQNASMQLSFSIFLENYKVVDVMRFVLATVLTLYIRKSFYYLCGVGPKWGSLSSLRPPGATNIMNIPQTYAGEWEISRNKFDKLISSIFKIHR